MLEFVNGFGIEEVVFTFATPLVFASGIKSPMSAFRRVHGMGQAVAARNLLRNFIEPNATETADGAAEILIDEFTRQANGLEDLGTGVRRDGRDPHLRHDLQDTLARRLDVVGDRLDWIVHLASTLGNKILNRFKGEVRVDRSSAVAN